MPRITAQTDDVEILAEMKKLREMYQLKRVQRYGSSRDLTVHSESVAEHVFGILTLAEYFYPLEDPQNLLNRSRITQLALLHDIGEVETGDVIFHIKTKDDDEREAAAVASVAKKLPSHMSELALGCFTEYSRRETPEARYLYALDKIEPIFELFDTVNMQSYNRLGITKEIAVGKKWQSTETFPVMRRFLDAWYADSLSHGDFAPSAVEHI